MRNKPLLPNIARGTLWNGRVAGKVLLLDRILQGSSFPGLSLVLGNSDLGLHIPVKHEIIRVDSVHDPRRAQGLHPRRRVKSLGNGDLLLKDRTILNTEQGLEIFDLHRVSTGYRNFLCILRDVIFHSVSGTCNGLGLNPGGLQRYR